jgi:hypothetical protein
MCGVKLEYPKTNTCSKSCQRDYRSKSNSRIVSEITKAKISATMKSKSTINKIEKNCLVCDGIHYNKNRKTCSKECLSKYKKRTKKEGYSLYRHLCKFDFNLADYPTEFDFSLIEQYGWYKAKNRGDNSNGVSRDHMLSVRYAFDNNIDPKIVKHPANCQLLQHRKNSSKNTKCDISLNELLERISEWNRKYCSNTTSYPHLFWMPHLASNQDFMSQGHASCH